MAERIKFGEVVFWNRKGSINDSKELMGMSVEELDSTFDLSNYPLGFRIPLLLPKKMARDMYVWRPSNEPPEGSLSRYNDDSADGHHHYYVANILYYKSPSSVYSGGRVVPDATLAEIIEIAKILAREGYFQGKGGDDSPCHNPDSPNADSFQKVFLKGYCWG